jgi:hypothetical protein
MTGANLSIIGKTLNHRSPQSTAIYARVDNGPVKEAMEVAVSAMLANRKTNECDAITVRNVEASAERRLRLITKEPDAVEMVNAMIVEKDPKDLAYEGNDEHDSGWELIL